MAHSRIRAFVRRGYDNVHLALWSALIAGLICFVAFVVPNLSKLRAQYEAARAARMEAEHDFYCRKWHITPGTDAYRDCMSDLQQFRRSVEQQVADESLF